MPICISQPQWVNSIEDVFKSVKSMCKIRCGSEWYQKGIHFILILFHQCYMRVNHLKFSFGNKSAKLSAQGNVLSAHWAESLKNVTTVGCRYNTVKFLTNIHKRRPIARPLGGGMGCLLWIQHLIDIQPQFLQLFMQYLTISNRVITALDCSV